MAAKYSPDMSLTLIPEDMLEPNTGVVQRCKSCKINLEDFPTNFILKIRDTSLMICDRCRQHLMTVL